MSEKQRILMVDDDIQAVDTVETLLQSVGYETNHSYMAAEGIQLARTWKPDLILLDVMFAGPPGPDGFEVSRDLHADPDLKDTPVIILSGLKKFFGMTTDFAPDETWMPVKAFLEKPVKPATLLEAIQKVLGPDPNKAAA
ncbi:MAG: response regulator [Anaerolineae bacterium]|jgi:CheY-like chemotaxis protein|nr:response regulator [Anaerolineae bacterium]